MNNYSMDSKDPTQRPILLFGMPRSGTTWIGKLFDSHPDTLYRHEPDTWRLLEMPRYPSISDVDHYARKVRTFIELMPSAKVARVAASRPLMPKEYQSRVGFWLAQGSAWMARVGSRVSPDFPVLFSSTANGYPACRLVWKSIESLGRLGVVVRVLPDARAIHILRHPCGYIASVLRGERDHRFVSRTSVSEDYGVFNWALGSPLNEKYSLSSISFKSLRPEERLAWNWVLLNEKVCQECDSMGQVLRIFYEDVCLAPNEQVAKMFGFVGLDVRTQTEAFIAASTIRSRQGYYSVFRNPISAAARWQSELEPSSVERILAIVRRSPFAIRYGRHPLQSSSQQ